MRYIINFVLILLPSICFSETLATCSSQMGYSFYANLGIVDSKNSGWKTEPPNGTISLSKLPDGKFDILFIDATKEIHSSIQEGAIVKLLRSNNNEMAFLVSDPKDNSLEIYTFLQDKNGRGLLTILTNEGGDNAPFYKSSVENAECSSIKFEEIKN